MKSVRGSRFVTVPAVMLLGSLMFLASGTNISFGQDRHKISWSAKPENTKYTFQHGLEIPNIQGHVLRIFEIRRTWPDGGAPTIQGAKVVEEVVWGTADVVTGNGLARGYSTWRYENGDQSFHEWENSCQAVVNPDRSRKWTCVGTYVMTAATGKLKGLKGVGRFSAQGETNAEGKSTANASSYEGEYWFEK